MTETFINLLIYILNARGNPCSLSYPIPRAKENKTEREKMSVIKKSKNQGNNRSDVIMPVYAGTLSTADWNTITEKEITNRIVGANGTEGARSFIKIVRLTSIEGRKVGMLVREGDIVTKDVVTVIGMTNSDVIVRFEDEETEYSIKRAQVRFVLGVE